MAQKNGSRSKTARVTVDTQKKGKCEKEVKLPALPSPTPNKKVKAVPMPSKQIVVPNGVAKTVKAPATKSPSKQSARSAPTKLFAAVTPQPPQLAAQATSEGKVSEGKGPNVTAVQVTQGMSASPTATGSQPAKKAPSDSAEGLSIARVEASTDALVMTEAAAPVEEADHLRQINGNGMAKLIYENYDELFPIEDGSTTQANVDEVYCLSFVMPKCLVHLSRHPNPERFQREENGIFDSLLREDPRGIYHDLEKDQTYYVVVEQETDQLRRDQEATKAAWDGELQKLKTEGKEDGRGFETCSCIYGNPCVDEYGCRDWHSRLAVATKNGWKGF